MSYMPSEVEIERRDAVMEAIIRHIQTNQRIELPPFDPKSENRTLGAEDNPFWGTYGPYRYQFEGEEDLLHLIVTRSDQEKLTVEEAQTVAAFLMPKVPAGLIWLRPGEYSQHFWVGHDELLR
jgi:hypothetical protein